MVKLVKSMLATIGLRWQKKIIAIITVLSGVAHLEVLPVPLGSCLTAMIILDGMKNHSNPLKSSGK